MSDTKKRMAFDEFVSEEDCRFVTVETKRGTIELGSACSEDIIEWFEDNEDKVRGQFSGLRLVVKCFINPDGTRVPRDKESQEKALTMMKRRDSLENGLIVRECLKLNGLRAKQSPIVEAALKNALSEAGLDASPSGSPDTSAT